jgi:dienelactone hydrolase
MMLFAVICLSVSQPASPLEFGKKAVLEAVGTRSRDVSISVQKSAKPETFRIRARNGKVEIVGSDETGAMYGAYEFAERTKTLGDRAWKTDAQGSPFLKDRGLNLFLTLPWDYKKNDTDYDPAALTDPNRWWFHNEDYWTTLFDLMAKSRLNWLDIHGAWDISVTSAPNLYAFFIKSDSFPKVGVSDEIKQANLKQLNHVIEMAHARGIKVSLMAYEANLRIPQNPNPPYQATEANIYKYTKEVVEKTIRQAPGLDAIGFRIGESGRGESFFNCYLEAVKSSGRHIPLITRSWITRKQKVLPLARGSKDFTVEIKYNGEQWGAPYPVVGGRVPNWHSYSFEDYLSHSGDAHKNAKTWEGLPTSEGGKWPSQPYKIVWQVRANGTHRIFPFYNPEWVRRSIKAMKLGTTSGYTIEGINAYFPAAPDYYLADLKNKGYNWVHQRDEMYWMTWGRLGYDPSTPDAVFDKHAGEFLGKGSEPLVQAWKKSSLHLPQAFMAYSLGPDHRNHAPELEWGGDTNAFIQGQGFDTQSFFPINEEYANRTTGGIDGRLSLWDLAVGMGLSGSEFESVTEYLKSSSPRVREIANAVQMMAGLKEYYVSRFKSAHQAANIEATFGNSYTNSNVKNIEIAAAGFNFLASNPFYKPFTDRLRMHTNTFSWAEEMKKVAAESKRLEGLPPVPREVSFWAANMNGPLQGKLTWRDHQGEVVCHLQAEKTSRAWLLVKPLPSSAFFHRIPMRKVGSGFEAKFPRQNWGHAIAAEALRDGGDGDASRFPNSQVETPYLVVPAKSGPTPQIYNAEEATAHLRPEVITPEKYSGMIIGTRAWNFFGYFDKATKRKVLDPVERGMRLVILQQDFNRYKLDWLPKPLKFEAVNLGVFEPAGALGLSKVEAPGLIYQRFLPSEGWEVFGNGGIARLKIGKGEVWVTSARLMQSMHRPDAAKAFVRLLSLGGKEKPTILVDSCSDGADLASSCHPDLMNSHDIPFLTLGEVVAKEQGMDSFAIVPGIAADDDVLNGRGSAMANAFLKGQVQKMSTLAPPPSQAAFETFRKRAKKELMRSLGLDPMPAKTPLNARITGVLQRNGYRIEKVVFESRPRFYVTAHVYVPDKAQGKLPIIVNVNGHWAHKKGEDRLQLRSAFAALQGYMAITVDSPGFSFEGNSLIERRAEGDHNDFALVEGGSNATGYYVWDTIRALDYAATRSDTDMTRIGLTGASGGGLATLYTFAADDRYKAAVPVVYMSSMELAPDNGCLCNHVPGTSQIGDRSDVIAIQAPKPVYIMGAQNDGEFPPNAMNLTGQKIKKLWSVFGKDSDTFTQIFAGPHDYNKPMREQMIGFFNKYLRGMGDGSPVPEPPIQVIDPEDRQILVLNPSLPNERTMRDLSKEYLANAQSSVAIDQAIALNGGIPDKSDAKYKEIGTGNKRAITFESEPGLVTPGVLVVRSGKPKGLRIVVSDQGKQAEVGVPSSDGFATLYLDTLGTGELSQIELRYPIYMGKSVPFIAGWQIVRAAQALREYSGNVELVGKGPISSQSVMWAGLMDGSFAKVTGLDCLKTWVDVFDPSVSSYTVQPRAHLLGSLDNLRAQVKQGIWRMRP